MAAAGIAILLATPLVERMDLFELLPQRFQQGSEGLFIALVGLARRASGASATQSLDFLGQRRDLLAQVPGSRLAQSAASRLRFPPAGASRQCPER